MISSAGVIEIRPSAYGMFPTRPSIHGSACQVAAAAAVPGDGSAFQALWSDRASCQISTVTAATMTTSGGRIFSARRR
jgi:hypothetical protein